VCGNIWMFEMFHFSLGRFHGSGERKERPMS
jgi:hypothetical protein